MELLPECAIAWLQGFLRTAYLEWSSRAVAVALLVCFFVGAVGDTAPPSAAVQGGAQALHREDLNQAAGKGD